jgi:hypothetical protein
MGHNQETSLGTEQLKPAQLTIQSPRRFNRLVHRKPSSSLGAGHLFLRLMVRAAQPQAERVQMQMRFALSTMLAFSNRGKKWRFMSTFRRNSPLAIHCE